MARQKKYPWYYRWWIKARLTLAFGVILVGLVIGLLSLLLPFESLYQDRLERFLEAQWNLKVKVKEIDGSWQGYGPYFQLNDLELTGKQSMQLANASLSINVYQLLMPGGRTGIDLSINRAELDMIHTADGASITINDDKDEARFTDLLDRILTTGSLRVDQMLFSLADENGKVLLAGLQADLLLQQDDKNRALQLLIENGKQSIEIVSQGLRSDSLSKDAHWYMRFNQFELSELNDLLTELTFPAGRIDGEVWASAVDGRISSLSGELTWQNPSSDFGFEIKIKQFSIDKNWLASLLFTKIIINNQPHDEFLVNLQRQDDQTQIKSKQIPVPLLSQLLADMGSDVLDPDWLSSVSGFIDRFEMSIDNKDDMWQGSLDFSDLSMHHDSFSFEGLDGVFEFKPQNGNLLLWSEAGFLRIPEIYRGQLDWRALTVQNALDWSGEYPSLKVNNFWCDCTDYELKLWGNLDGGEPKNLLLTSSLTDVDVSQLYKYWPHNVWKPKTLEWLDRGLLSGRVDKGYVFFNGDLVPNAFKTGAANFISRAYTNDVDNVYHPEWPPVDNIDAVAVFDHDSVKVDLLSAQTMGIDVQQAVVNIDSFDTGVLDVSLNASAQGNAILDYLRISPLVKNLELSDGINIGGRQNIDLGFDVAIKPEVYLPFQPQGKIVFDHGSFATEHFTIENINGPVELNGYGLGIKDLAAKLGVADVKLNGEIITKSADGLAIDVNLDGSLSAEYLLNIVQQDLPIVGESDWQINIQNQQDTLRMLATSTLTGTAIELPAPLKKSASERKQLSIACDIPCQESTVEINFNDEIKSTLESQAGNYHLVKLQFIDRDSTSSQNQPFGGHITHLNLDQWLALIATRSQDTEVKSLPNQWPANEVEISIGEMLFMSRAFRDLEMNIKRTNSRYEISIKGKQMQGLVVVDDDLEQKGIVAQFEHLDWIEPITRVDEVVRDVADSKVPDIHLWSKSFYYAGIPLGELRMEMRNVADGIKVEQLSLKSPEAEINASGFWNKAAGRAGRSDFNIVMISEKIADFLQQVGFAAPITNAQTLIELNAQWNGVPSEFNIANIDGALNIKIGQGQVLDQKPGFGRVLGLFNLTNLPRRLILDFRDVLADGLLFSSMEGNFEIKAGVANTQDFMITASSAKIHIKGDVGFADQSYDQTITVRPQIGKTFPTIGAIAGGPVGAAAGFLVQGLFDKQLKKGNEIIYTVTGTWDEPVIELIEKNNNQ